MAATAVMTIRIDPELLAALKERARREGRTVSAAVVQLVRREIGTTPRRSTKRTMGMFPDFEAPDLEDLLRLRREISRSFGPRRRRRG